ncbi:BUD13 homolog [Nasonia vitripennis]|uniref:Platelet-derived growth factor (PDGF) family profile domain-containing protein n=1 Tax=Nasonia vitripennis TaxID=7425 RepID=A0A7M7GFU6_NASVI|nr:BUD13 homolog [Nasonia vitripennis]
MRTTRVLLASLALLLLCLLLAGEARRYADDEDLADRAPHHKHRHRHELQPRWPSAGKKRASNDAEDDYYDDSDYEDYLDEDESAEEEYKDRRAGRSHSPKRSGGNQRRYPPPRYHHRGSHHVGSARGHEARAHDRLGSNRHRAGSRGTGYPRKRYEDEDSELEAEYDRLHRRRYDDSDEEDDYHAKHKSPRRRIVEPSDSKARRSRYEPPRKDWRYKLDDEEDDYAYDADDEAEESEELENERANRSRKHSARKSFRPAHHEVESPKPAHRRATAYSKLDEWMKRVRNSSRSHERRNPSPWPEDAGDEDDELELWKDEEPEDKELDNDFYKNDESTSLKSYDDIIRRLTEERTTTSTSTAAPVKRDYRNTFYDSKRRHANLVDSTGRKKSLQDEEEEEEDDDEEAQADANMDYNDDDFLASASSPSTTRGPPPTTSTTSTTSTTTTTTTARPWYSASKNTRNFSSDNSGYQAKSERPMSPISAAKWGDLGTREGVEKTRNSMLSESSKASDFSAAQSHAIRVAREGSCRWPRAKVIPVLDIYYNSTTNYWPHCVILHRCSDDTGCCRHESFTCEAKHIQRVELAFHVVSLHGSQGVAKLTFDNHTECRCSERKNLESHRNPRHNVQAPANIVKQQRPRKPCRCPSNFLPMITSDDSCECTCPDRDREETCQKLLMGRGYLSNVDRQCIKEERCMAPKCFYGAYLVETGGCPQKKKFIDSNVWSRRPSNNYQYPRGRSWRTP